MFKLSRSSFMFLPLLRSTNSIRSLDSLRNRRGRDTMVLPNGTYLLRLFLAVAEARSFSGAARATHSTQSALSRQIAKLEKELGVQLFMRYGRHVDTTPTGQLLLPLVENVVAGTERILSLAQEQAGTATRKVRFGAVPNVLANLLAPILVSFLAESPDMSVDLVGLEDALLEEAVANGELDCAVITPWGSGRLATRHLLTEEILLVVPEGHRLAGCEAVRSRCLRTNRFCCHRRRTTSTTPSRLPCARPASNLAIPTVRTTPS